MKLYKNVLSIVSIISLFLGANTALSARTVRENGPEGRRYYREDRRGLFGGGGVLGTGVGRDGYRQRVYYNDGYYDESPGLFGGGIVGAVEGTVDTAEDIAVDAATLNPAGVVEDTLEAPANILGTPRRYYREYEYDERYPQHEEEYYPGEERYYSYSKSFKRECPERKGRSENYPSSNEVDEYRMY